jgi:hypothetical protein
VATPTLTVTATLNSPAINRAAELEALDQLCKMAIAQARGMGGATASGTVNAPGTFGSNGAPGTPFGSASWIYTANQSS